MHLALGNFSSDQVLSRQFILLFVICQVRSGEVSAQTIDGGNGPGLPCLRTGSCDGFNPQLALAVGLQWEKYLGSDQQHKISLRLCSWETGLRNGHQIDDIRSKGVYSSTLTRSPMSNATLSDPLAPNFALLPPDLARKLQLATFVTTGSLAIFIWDILHCLSAEYTLLFKYKAHWSLVAYFLSKFGSFGYVLGFTLFGTYPIGRCSTLYLVSNSFYPVAVTSTSLLFYFASRSVTAVFGILWLAVLGTGITIPFGGLATTIEPTPYCIVTEVASFVGASTIVITVHDTAVFLAVSYRLVSNTHAVHGTLKSKLKAVFSGTSMPCFSKALYVDGQFYYMISAFSNIAVTVMVYAPHLHPAYHGLLAIPNVMLTSVMACRVYRNTKLGTVRESTDVSLAVRTIGGGSIPVHLSRPTRRTSIYGEDTVGADRSAGAVFIAMTKTTQTMRDPPDSREARSEAFES
ncbi:hypothetical protein B0H10DRAFT_2083321 [Mycena sp. CBHHK59/15]|nr:hypothetical protein B0H10DRAFT_2083321 [Mycena sp. CBHHK59/15]